MSSKENDNELKDLFNKVSKTEKPVDDFEREALEGFAMLENENEAFALKAELDAEITPVLASAAKKQNKAIYWMAAAALVVMIGFTVYFVQSNPLEVKQNIAENKVKPEILKDKENQPLDTQMNRAKTTMPEPIVEKKPAPENSTESYKAFKPTKTVQSNELKSETLESNNYSNDDNKADVAETPAAGVVVNGNSVARPTEDLEEADKIVATSPAQAPAANENYKEVAVLESKKNKKALAYSNQLAKTPVAVSANTNTQCDYHGGVKVFTADLEQALKKLNLGKLSLKGTIIVGPNGEAINVGLSQTGNLSKKQIKKVTEVIKTLKKFVLPPNSNAEMYYYNFEYAN